ncbi:helix-turn-helix transcriptional regulator [Kitasatospora sp. MAP5-34]|uniref:helix-turn-helix domain-containing protein n=1 Tax=Kitasatospora sp. MAP5-34 TaxID=3035102 RepID=UPI00247346B2|nr:helix-turn-helix transcriptional regulator [Kitasatospora sp. MAP5-34]MDH6574575.1 transcriptional regulator with XRE-family HTH domain [Kitasatospora sp. MAP5-34]
MAMIDGEVSAGSLAQYWGQLLKKHREAAGYSGAAFGRLIGYSAGAVSQFESATRVMKPETARACDELFKTDGLLEGLLEFILKADLPTWFTSYVDHEGRASEIRTYEPQVIPGLLQTEEYARAVLEAGRLDSIDQPLAMRMSRQRILEGEGAPYLWVILEQTAIEKQIGGPEVMRPQLERLIAEAKKPRIVIQIVPKTIGAHAGLDGPLTILSFPEGPDMGYVDGHASGQLIVKTADVARCARIYDLLRSTALSADSSIALLEAAMEELAP